MKLRNRLFAILLMVGAANVLMAQNVKVNDDNGGSTKSSGGQYKVTVDNPATTKLKITNFTGDLPIEGYVGNEIIITNGSESEGTPERAKGLKQVFPGGGTDNSGIGVSVEKGTNEITLDCLLPFSRSGDYKIKIPESMAVSITSGCERNNAITISNMKNEIEINNCHDITLKNVTGPLVLSTISGDVTVTLASVSKDKATSIASVSGDIDVTMPATAAVDLEMSTVSGNMYSDFDIAVPKGNMKRVGGNEINTQLNGGGGMLKLHNVSGNIYLRKAKS